METKQIEKEILAIHQKLDYITEQLQQQQRKQREWQELKADLTLVGKDVFQTAVSELDEVATHFDSTDLLYLLKKLLRNTRNLARMTDQIESVSDFMKDAAPLGKQVFNEVMETLSELEEKGYFEFSREFFRIMDTVVTSFTIEDLVLLRQNITSILLTVKNMTQPQMLSSMNNALNFFQKMDVDISQDISYWQLFKDLQDPEMKRGIAFMIQFMKNMVHTNAKEETDQQK